MLLTNLTESDRNHLLYLSCIPGCTSRDITKILQVITTVEDIFGMSFKQWREIKLTDSKITKIMGFISHHSLESILEN